MVPVVLFVLGLAIGSFLNVLALRYNGDHFVFDAKVIGGRSHCPHCHHQLAWYELFPLVSYHVQGGRCRHCRARIGFQYPLVEFLSGLIFAFVPLQFPGLPVVAALWIAALEVVLLIAYIDLRLQIVPDELNVLLGAVAIFTAIFTVGALGPHNLSFFSPTLAALAGLQDNFWLAHLAGAAFGGGFFALLILLTRGRGMGWGDVKFGIPLGFLFGWPDIAVLYGVAFVVGAIVGSVFLARKEKTMGSALPFVPFLAVGTAVAVFFGSPLFGWYAHAIGLR